jgi:peptide/nickel transport system substrate-binding protein
LISSPAQWEKLGRDWSKLASQPSGTGPFKLDKLVPRERAELVKNVAYWDKTRMAKTDRIILMPIPDAMTRANALLNGQVDIIETPPPDVLPAPLLPPGDIPIRPPFWTIWSKTLNLPYQ